MSSQQKETELPTHLVITGKSAVEMYRELLGYLSPQQKLYYSYLDEKRKLLAARNKNGQGE